MSVPMSEIKTKMQDADLPDMYPDMSSDMYPNFSVGCHVFSWRDEETEEKGEKKD